MTRAYACVLIIMSEAAYQPEPTLYLRKLHRVMNAWHCYDEPAQSFMHLDLKFAVFPAQLIHAAPSAKPQLHHDDNDCENKRHSIRDHHRPIPQQNAQHEPEGDTRRESDVHPQRNPLSAGNCRLPGPLCSLARLGLATHHTEVSDRAA